MHKEYDKLIRDRIPEIIESQGKKCKIEKMDEDEFSIYLKKKLKEEVDEFQESGEIHEIVDIYEVILAILDTKDISLEEFEEIRQNKASERGRFEENLKLLEVRDD